MQSLPLIYKLVFDEEKMKDFGISLISFVDDPAIERNFMYFKNEKEKTKVTFNSEKHIVTGPAMIPDKKIIRYNKDDNGESIGDPFFVFFDEPVIRECQEWFWKNSDHKKSKLDHEFGIEGVTIIESWIIEDVKMDKSTSLGFKDLPVGTWMISFKIDNDVFWNKIKNKEVVGFSIEGNFIPEIFLSKAEKVETSTFLYNGIENTLNSFVLTNEEKYNKITEILKIK